MSGVIDPAEAKLETKFWELTNPANPAKHNEEKAIDVVAVHGLNGQPNAAHWKNEDGSMWLCDLLPKDIRHVRVFELAYDPKELLVGSNDAADSLARFLLARLWVAREDDPKPRPLVFLAHGFGGFVVEKTINYLTESQTDLAELTPCIKKIIFLSTPQRAPDEIEWNSLMGNCMADCMDWRAPFFSRSVDETLGLLQENKEFLQEVTTEFRKNVARLKIKIFSCYEEVPTPPLEKCSVNETNAALGLKLEKLRAMSGCNHISIAKYSSREDENYQAIMLAIKKVLRSASVGKPATKATKGPSQVNISVIIHPSIPPTAEKPVKGFSQLAANKPVAPPVAVKPPKLQPQREHSAPVVARDESDPARLISNPARAPAGLPQSTSSPDTPPQPLDRNKSITRRPFHSSVLVKGPTGQLSTSGVAGKGTIPIAELPASLPNQSKPPLKEPKRPQESSDSAPPAKWQELDPGGLKRRGQESSKQSVGINTQVLSGNRESSSTGKQPQVSAAPPTGIRHELDVTLPPKPGPAAGPPQPAQGQTPKMIPGAVSNVHIHTSITTGVPASLGPGVPQQAYAGSRVLPSQLRPSPVTEPKQPPQSYTAAGQNVQQPQQLKGPAIQSIPSRTSNLTHDPGAAQLGGTAVLNAPRQVKSKYAPLTARPSQPPVTVEKGAPSHTSTSIHVEQKAMIDSYNVAHGTAMGAAVSQPPSGTRQPPFQAMPPPQKVRPASSAPSGQPAKPQVTPKIPDSQKSTVSGPPASHVPPHTTSPITKSAFSGSGELPTQDLPTAQKTQLHSREPAPRAAPPHTSRSLNTFIQNVAVHTISQSIHTHVDPKSSGGNTGHDHVPYKPVPIPQRKPPTLGPSPPHPGKSAPASGGSHGYTAFKPYTQPQATLQTSSKGPVPFRPGLVQHSHSTSDVLTMSSGKVQGPSPHASAPTNPGHRVSIAALPSILSSGPTASKGVTSSAYTQLQQPVSTTGQGKTSPSLFPGLVRGSAQPAPFAANTTKSIPPHSGFPQASGTYIPPPPSRLPPGPALLMPHTGPAHPSSRPSSMPGPPGGLFGRKPPAPATSGFPPSRPPMISAASHPPSSSPHHLGGNPPPRPFTLSEPPSVRPGAQPTAAGHPPLPPPLPASSSHPPSGPPGRPTGSVPYRPFSMSGPSAAVAPSRPPGLVAGFASAPGPGPSAPHRPFSISGPPSNLLPGGRGRPPPSALTSGPPGPRPPALNVGPPKPAVPPNRHSISGPPPHSLPKGLQPGPAPPAKPGFLGGLFGAKQPTPPKPQPPASVPGQPALGKPPIPPPGPGVRHPGPRPPFPGPPGDIKPPGPPKPPGPKPTPGGWYQPYRGPQGRPGKPPGSRPSGHPPAHAGPPKPGPGAKPPGHHGPPHGPGHGPHHGGQHGPHHGGGHGPHPGPHHGPDHGHGHGHGWFDWLHGGKHHPTGTNVLVDPTHHPLEIKPEDTKPTDTKPEQTKPTGTQPEEAKSPGSGTEEGKPTVETKPEESKSTEARPEEPKPPGTETEENKPTAETKPEDEGKPTGTEGDTGIQATEATSEGRNKLEKPGSNITGAEQKPQDGNNVPGRETDLPGQAGKPTVEAGTSPDSNKPVDLSIPDTNAASVLHPTSAGTSPASRPQDVNQIPTQDTAEQDSTAPAPAEGERGLHTDSGPHFTFIQSQSQTMYNMYAPYQPLSTEQPPAVESETSRSLTDNTPNLGFVQPQTIYNAYPGSGDSSFTADAGQTPPSDTTPHFGFVQSQTVYNAYPAYVDSTSSEGQSQQASGPEQQYEFVQPQTVHGAPSVQATPGSPNPDNQHLQDSESAAPPPLRQMHTALFPNFKDARPQSSSVSEDSPHLGLTQTQTATPAGQEQSFSGYQQTPRQSTAGYGHLETQNQNTAQPPPVLPTHTAVFPDFATIRPPTTSEPDDSTHPGFQHETIPGGQVQAYVAFQPPGVQANPGHAQSEPERQDNTVPPPVRPMHTAVFPDLRDSKPPASSGLGGSPHLGFTASQSVYAAYTSPEGQPSTTASSIEQKQGPSQLQSRVTPKHGNEHQPGSPDDRTAQPPPVLPTHTAAFPGFQNRDILQPAGASPFPGQQDKTAPTATMAIPPGGTRDLGHDAGHDTAQQADIVGDERPRNFLGIYYPGEQSAEQAVKADAVGTHAGLSEGLGLHNTKLGADPSPADATRAAPAAGKRYTAFFPSSPNLTSQGVDAPQTSSTIPQQSRDIPFGAQPTPSPLNPAAGTTTSGPGEAATYYDSFDKPNPFPSTTPQPPFQAYQPYTSQTQPQQAQPSQATPHPPYAPGQEQKKSSSGTALKVAAGVVAGAAVAGLATAGIMHALHEHDDPNADTTPSHIDASANTLPRDVPGAAPGMQQETAPVSDLSDSDAYADTIDSSDLESIKADSDDDRERSVHAEAQHAGSQYAEPPSADTSGVPFVGPTPAPSPFGDHEHSDHHYNHSDGSVADSSDLDTDDAHSDVESIANLEHQQESARAVDIENDSHDPFNELQTALAAAQLAYSPADEHAHDSDHENDSVADSSELDTDDAHMDGGDSEHGYLSRDLNFHTEVHGQCADHDDAGNEYFNEPYFPHAEEEHAIDPTNMSDPSVSDSDEHEHHHGVPDSDVQSDSGSNYIGHPDMDDERSENEREISDHGYQDLGQQHDAAGLDDNQYDSDYEQHLNRAMEDIPDHHDNDDDVAHEVEDSDEDHEETAYHPTYPYQPEDSDQEHNTDDSDAAGDEPQFQPGYWDTDDHEDEDGDQHSEVASPETQHPAGYWEGDDEDEDENDANQHPAGYWEGDDDESKDGETTANQYPQGYWQGDNGQEDDDSDIDDDNEEHNDGEDSANDEDEDNTNQYPQGYWPADDDHEDGGDSDSDNDNANSDDGEYEEEDNAPQYPSGYWQGNGEDKDDSDDDDDEDENNYQPESQYQNQYQQDSDDEDDDGDDDDDEGEDEPTNTYQAQYYDQSQYQNYEGGGDDSDGDDSDDDEVEDQGQYQQYQPDYSQNYQQEYHEQEPVYQEQYQDPEPVYQQEYQQEYYQPEPEYQPEPSYQQEDYKPEPVYQQEYQQQEYYEPEPVYQQEPVYYEEQPEYDYSGGYEQAEFDNGGDYYEGYDGDDYGGGDYYEEYD